jgi:dTDP-glucose 4,6-dehydratase
MKKIIITGGSGFIGSNLVKYLLKKNFFVINIDKITYSGTSYNLKDINKKKYIFYKTDINNRKKIRSILQKHKPLAIFNLAAETHVDRSIDSPYNFISSNILGVFNLLEVLKNFNKNKKKKIKLIHISTDEVYGDVNNFKIRTSEKYPYAPSSPYSASKASADHLVGSYVRTYNIPAVISNCCNNYGPGQFPEKLIPKIIFNIINNKPLPVYGVGKNSREWIHVDDHCEALFMLYLKGKNGESYNVGSGKNLKNINLIKMILKIIKNKQIKIGDKARLKFVKDRPGHDLRYALNSRKIYKLLKWKSKTKINIGLSKTIDWYLKNIDFFKKIPKNNYNKRLGLKI